MAVRCICGEDITGKEGVAGSCSTECNSLRMEVYRISKREGTPEVEVLCNSLAYSLFSGSSVRETSRLYVRWKKNTPCLGEEAKARKAVDRAIERLVSYIKRSFQR